MRASVTARSSSSVDLTIDGATYADVPVSTWPEGGYANVRTYTAAQIEWTEVPADHPVHAIVNDLDWPELETIEGMIADAIDRHQRDEHDNRYL